MPRSVLSSQINLMDLQAWSDDVELGLLALLRREDPLHWTDLPDGDGFWSLTRYEDVRNGATEARILSSAQGTQIVSRKVEGHLQSLHNMDDPQHAPLRKVTIAHLRAVKVREWQEAIDASVSTLLDDAVARQGAFDLVDVVSARLPMLVLARVLGVPAEDGPRMVDWTNRLTSADPGKSVDASELVHVRDELLGYFQTLVEERRARPQEDLITVLVQGKVEGRPLTWDEIAAYIILIVAAGNETTRQALSGGTIALTAIEGSWQRLAKEEHLLGLTIEEMLRYVSPVGAMRRTAAEDLEMHGHTVRAGEKVVLWFSAANRDPELFADPDTFVLDRTPNEHLTFGWGVHFCLGAHLARAEMASFYRGMLDRGLTLEMAGTPERLRHNIFRGWTNVPVTVQELRHS